MLGFKVRVPGYGYPGFLSRFWGTRTFRVPGFRVPGLLSTRVLGFLPIRATGIFPGIDIPYMMRVFNCIISHNYTIKLIDDLYVQLCMYVYIIYVYVLYSICNVRNLEPLNGRTTK